MFMSTRIIKLLFLFIIIIIIIVIIYGYLVKVFIEYLIFKGINNYFKAIFASKLIQNEMVK